MEALAHGPNLPLAKRPYIHFALAKALEDCGDCARAFAHLTVGNALKRSQIPYDEQSVRQRFARVAALFDRSPFDRLSGEGDPSATPIFVVGMPRSGSTLIEQIVASSRAGSWRRRTAEPGGSGSRCGQPGRRNSSARLALPNAKIIHGVRNPIDTCLSCYSRLFANGQYFSYDLGELGRYYRRYTELMTHWRSVLPKGVMLDVAYENVIGDIEGQTRRMLDYCGLPWDDRCLDFHRTARPVKTASPVQVRSPLFRTPVERWRRYERWLGPLLRELSVPEDLDHIRAADAG